MCIQQPSVVKCMDRYQLFQRLGVDTGMCDRDYGRLKCELRKQEDCGAKSEFPRMVPDMVRLGSCLNDSSVY